VVLVVAEQRRPLFFSDRLTDPVLVKFASHRDSVRDLLQGENEVWKTSYGTVA